ncbi:hypothetical protein AAW51_3220 [Caldimonas brevitalea]|uniref:DUF2135 domain-containing protein n=1 Tax=Caldimonas brevitalea TaxID=413882 RepID=A0A0G3BRC7_9BURK|nr:hypothetical protein AAW51_3220 [Caldimonas brevitalea]
MDLQGPRGGWHAAGLLEDDERPAVAYPHNLIDRGAQKHRTLIQGRLATAQGRDRRSPHQLVVNGNPMPLYAGDDGRFVRPYAFGPGSNSIEVRRPDGGVAKRLQFYETRGNGPKAALRVIASWDDPQAEIDMHVVTPDGQHAFWAAPVLQGGGGLDVDSVDGAGPEMFSLSAPRKGRYHLYVNYWGNFGEAGYHFDETTRQRPVITVSLSVVTRENTPQEKRETFVVPLRRIGDLTWVKTVEW